MMFAGAPDSSTQALGVLASILSMAVVLLSYAQMLAEGSLTSKGLCVPMFWPRWRHSC